MSFANQVLDFHFSLKADQKLPAGVSWILPYDQEETRKAMVSFFQKYFDDKKKRFFLFGINPGRFGAGVTGIPFTDPVKLEVDCEIPNVFQKKHELSSRFVYEMIDEFGGPSSFYSKYYITSLCPLGFLKDHKNYNFYDDKELQSLVTPFIVENINQQIAFGADRSAAFSMGKGKNFKVFKKLNDEHQWFEKVLPLPHPRWVMQYRLKKKHEFIDQYVKVLTTREIAE